MCEIYQYAKAKRKTTHKKTTTVDLQSQGDFKKEHLRPGPYISVDHFESRIKGMTYTSYVRPTSEHYVGSYVFVDHMSGYIHIECQLGFSSSETIRGKQAYEKLCLDHGVIVDTYLANNGVFKANTFVQHILEHSQRLSFCVVNAHHQNGIAERSIRTVSDMARAMMLHVCVH